MDPLGFEAAERVRIAELAERLALLVCLPANAPVVARHPRVKLAHAIYPGLLAAGTIGLAATFLSQHYGAPVMLFALLLGMAFHFLHEDGRCKAGIEFSSRTVLRLGIAFLGARITASESRFSASFRSARSPPSSASCVRKSSRAACTTASRLR